MPTKQTVKIFLADGNPTGIRTLELLNWSGKGLIIPRESVDKINSYSELSNQGVYILFGSDENDREKVYIGESENLADRIRSHNKNKQFWNYVVCFFVIDGTLNKGLIKFLEELLIDEATKAGRVELENGNAPNQTRLSLSDKEYIFQFAENIKLILATIGLTFLKTPTEYEAEVSEVYICKGPAADASAIYSSEGMIVQRGSLARKQLAQSVNETDSVRRKQEQLLVNGVLASHNEESLIFTKDYVFSSPSMAAAIVLARNANGWTNWKRQSDGKTLDGVYRA